MKVTANYTGAAQYHGRAAEFSGGLAPIYPPQPEGYKRMDIALSWRRSDQGVQLLSVPANPSAEMWPWTKISDQSQGDGAQPRVTSTPTRVGCC